MDTLRSLFDKAYIERNQQELKTVTAQCSALAATLAPLEIYWRDRQRFLQSKGYMLRDRYHPDWVPSWMLPGNVGMSSLMREDSISLGPVFSLLIDATRMSDDRLVYIKGVRTHRQELEIASLLSSPSLASDPRNHSIPLLDTFEDDVDPTLSYIVMPFLRPIDRPPFESVDNVVDFVDQMLEGLIFMHEQGVAHRDCAFANIMMDADALFTEKTHPVIKSFDWPMKRKLTPLPRAGATIRYYYIDYGISTYFAPGEERGLVTGRFGRDQDVPELSQEIPYDPFKVDVFIIGNMLRTSFLNEYTNMAFLKPLIEAMTAPDAKHRVTALQALDVWQKVRVNISTLSRMWRLQSRSELWLVRYVLDGVSVGMKIMTWLEDMQG